MSGLVSGFLTVLAVLFFFGSLIGLPLVCLSGWVKWFQDKSASTSFSTLSVLGFSFGTLSLLLDASTAVYAYTIGGFPFYDPLLMRIYLWGGRLSLVGMAFGLIGVWRSGVLRWRGIVLPTSMLLLWFMAAMAE